MVSLLRKFNVFFISIRNLFFCHSLSINAIFWLIYGEKTHEHHIFTKFRNDCVKIVDFLMKAYFWISVNLGVTYCILRYMCKAEINKSSLLEILNFAFKNAKHSISSDILKLRQRGKKN